MNTSSLTEFSPRNFHMETSTNDDGLRVSLRGNADMNIIDPLDQYLSAVHDRAMQTRVACVNVDFRELEFMNSSCFKSFVSWLGKVQDLPESNRYRIVFFSNRDMHWQRRSLNALRCFAMDVVSLEQ